MLKPYCQHVYPSSASYKAIIKQATQTYFVSLIYVLYRNDYGLMELLKILY